MIPALIALAGGSSALPVTPLPEEVALGERLGREGVRSRSLVSVLQKRRDRAHPDSVSAPEARPLGMWSDGVDRHPVERAVWMTPGLISRWLGWRRESEAWPPGEVEGRWEDARTRLDGRTAFVVFLAAYPRKGTLGLSDDGPSSDRDLSPVRFRLKVDGQETPVMITPLARWQGRTRQVVEARPWWLWTPLATALQGSFDPQLDEGLPLGEYHRRLYWIEASPIGLGSKVELEVLGPRKVRRASWEPQPQ